MFTPYDQRMLTDTMLSTQNQHFQFRVKACSGAAVAIATANTEEGENEYFVVIGDDNNRRTTVQQRQSNDG